MSRYKIGVDFGATGYSKDNASLWVLIRTFWIFLRYDDKPPVTVTIKKGK